MMMRRVDGALARWGMGRKVAAVGLLIVPKHFARRWPRRTTQPTGPALVENMLSGQHATGHRIRCRWDRHPRVPDRCPRRRMASPSTWPRPRTRAAPIAHGDRDLATASVKSSPAQLSKDTPERPAPP